MVHETLRCLRGWLAGYRETGVTMDGEAVSALIKLTLFYDAQFTILQSRLAGAAVPIEPGGNVVDLRPYLAKGSGAQIGDAR
ncbi:hypothetical protein PY649_20455 [Rhizobium mayense]|uniref:Uncharacterized protein n=2 Tax=Rhizobium mayense TaxID=1312184 RepID=A0ABT7JZD7_9HYPH|nr:hypothetical protein [Rhizobium mayense]